MSEAKSNRITPSCSQETSVSYVPTVIESLKSDYRLLMRIKHTLLKKNQALTGLNIFMHQRTPKSDDHRLLVSTASTFFIMFKRD